MFLMDTTVLYLPMAKQDLENHTLLKVKIKRKEFYNTVCKIYSKKRKNNKIKVNLLNLDIETKVYISYLEIYNEDLRDLLDPTKKNLKIFSTNDGVMVKNLSRVFCENLDDVMNLLNEGKKIRIVGSHAMNIKSSRSHAIFMIHIVEKEGPKLKMAKLNLVDLAGSER